VTAKWIILSSFFIAFIISWEAISINFLESSTSFLFDILQGSLFGSPFCFTLFWSQF
jgi:hypothetical protein